MKWKQKQENNQVPENRASDGAIEMLTTASDEISESTSNVAKNEDDLQIRKQSEAKMASGYMKLRNMRG